MDSLRLDVSSAPAVSPKKADLPAASGVNARSQPEVVPTPHGADKSQQITAASIDNAKAEMVQRAAHTVSNYFVVSDVKFTIFKDTQGTYVTKFTNLKDGSISYYPEQELFRMYSRLSGNSVSLLSTDA